MQDVFKYADQFVVHVLENNLQVYDLLGRSVRILGITYEGRFIIPLDPDYMEVLIKSNINFALVRVRGIMTEEITIGTVKLVRKPNTRYFYIANRVDLQTIYDFAITMQSQRKAYMRTCFNDMLPNILNSDFKSLEVFDVSRDNLKLLGKFAQANNVTLVLSECKVTCVTTISVIRPAGT